MSIQSRHLLMTYAKGMAMGAADVVPGVSGGTVAFITGIYDELIGSLRAIDLRAVRLLLKGDIVQCWHHINGNFLLALFAGILTSILSLARLITHLLETQPIVIAAFFSGLILASAVLIARQIHGWHVSRMLLFMAGIALALVISEVRPGNLPLEVPWIFLAGSLAICAMILPGISGSFLLLLIGMYAPVLGAVKAFQLDVIAVFALGCAVGLLAFVRLLSWLLAHHRYALLAFLTGLLLGSLWILWPWKLDAAGALPIAAAGPGELHNVWPWAFDVVSPAQAVPASAAALFGLLLVLGLERMARRI